MTNKISFEIKILNPLELAHIFRQGRNRRKLINETVYVRILKRSDLYKFTTKEIPLSRIFVQNK